MTCRNIKIGTSVRTRANGKDTTYAPKTPAIAPLAPTLGTLVWELSTVWTIPAPKPQSR